MFCPIHQLFSMGDVLYVRKTFIIAMVFLTPFPPLLNINLDTLFLAVWCTAKSEMRRLRLFLYSR